MTIKELYDFAVKKGWENMELTITYDCPDCWYSFEEIDFLEDQLKCNENGEVVINI